MMRNRLTFGVVFKKEEVRFYESFASFNFSFKFDKILQKCSGIIKNAQKYSKRVRIIDNTQKEY